MKTTIALLLAATLGGGFAADVRAEDSTTNFALNYPKLATQLKTFISKKQTEAKAMTNEWPLDFKAFFVAAAAWDWPAVSNQFQAFRNHTGEFEHSGKTDERLHGPAWEAVKEAWGAFGGFFVGNPKYSTAFGREVIESIPPGSIYFGGTDPGRYIISALCKSQARGKPFFTLTQNALADGSYLTYLRSIYGGKIYIPTDEDSQRCFQEYVAAAQERHKNHQLKPEENVQVADGRVKISGLGAVMDINGLMLKTIFDKNPDREFYIEESHPIEWMYPQMEPHGLIFKINRRALPKLSDSAVQLDRAYWVKTIQPMIGDWLNQETTVAEIAVFAEKIHGQKDFSGFTGDPQFTQNQYSCKLFSKLRSAIAQLYVWRAQHAADAAEKKRMNDAADFAFRQSWALCPYSREAVVLYSKLH